MADLGSFMDVIKEAISDMPGKLSVASGGIKDLFSNFNDIVRKT